MQLEEEILNELRGQYTTSFYSIYLNGFYDADISKMSKRDQGTLLHEYIHYLQNISTLWGIYQSMTIYSLMHQSLHEVIANDPVTIPVSPNFEAQTISSYKKMKTLLGTRSLERGKYIDWTKDIKVNFSQVDVDGTTVEKVSCEVFLMNGGKEIIDLGATIVKETMAALYQSLVDPNSSHPDIPYNIILKYCQKYYPKLAADTRKLICLCYASLFTLCPGAQLMRLIRDYGNRDDIDGHTAFYQFVDTYDAGKKKDGTSRTLMEYVDEMIDKFKKMLSGILISNLDFLNVIFEPVRLSEKWVPVVSALYDKNTFSLDHLKIMFQQIGLPYLHTSKQQYSFPNGYGKTDASTDLVELIASQAIYTYFRGDSECRLSYMCKGDKYSEDHCKNHPWSQEIECPFSVVCKAYGIDKKTINRRR